MLEQKSEFVEEKRIRAAFLSIQGIGSARLRQLIAYYGSARHAWQRLQSEPLGLRSESWVLALVKKLKALDPLEIEEKLYENAIKMTIPEEESYPALLQELPDAPPLLYYRGTLAIAQEAVAIVGSRKATAYGRAAAEFLAKELARKDIVVVSGLARGIDTAAHKGSLAGNGVTWAVQGCGLNHLYPQENKKLAEQILERGAIFSELLPDTPPEPQFFPMRNRLISGMSRGTVVVEAASKSGSLITVDFALEQGREVFAVPGPIFSEQSKGAHHLIRQGAKIVETVEDILVEIPSLQACGGNTITGRPENKVPDEALHQRASNEQNEILGLLSDYPTHIDQIFLGVSVPAEQVPLFLLELQLAGKIEQLPGQLYVLAHKL